MQKTQVYKAIKYIRLSYTDDKTVESDSVANQRRLIDDFIEKHPEIEVVDEKIDDGYSGVLFDRPAFQEMMRMIEEGQANCVIVKDLSRLGREYIETGRYMRRVFPAYGVRFIAINDNVDTINDAADDLTVSVKNIMNEAYCRDISVKTRSALDVKRRSGDFVGAFAVYGYIKTGDKHKSLEIDPYAAKVVQDIFRMRLDGHSALHIAEELNRMGILSPLAYKRNNGMPHAKGGYTDKKDCKWSATTIIRILQDETYTGTLVQGKQTTPHFKLKERQNKPSSEWIRVENAHPCIIEKSDFDLVQRLRRLDTRTSPNSDKVYMFSGVLICGCCGSRMTRKTNRHKDKEYNYYYCPTGKKNGCTSSVMIKESDLIECVQVILKGHIDNVASLDTLLSSISQDRINRELASEYAEQIRVSEKRLSQIEGYKAKLYENLVSGILTKEEFLIYKSKYNADIEQLRKAIAEWNEKLTDILENRSERNRWINHFMKFSTMEEIDRRAVTHLIRSIRILGKDEIHVEFNYQDEYKKAVALAAQIAQAAEPVPERKAS
ncbi:MAG: recombinase family protein [Clostridia bacterium]|nr:recombinase family protein [Clostridia bacterium]